MKRHSVKCLFIFVFFSLFLSSCTFVSLSKEILQIYFRFGSEFLTWKNGNIQRFGSNPTYTVQFVREFKISFRLAWFSFLQNWKQIAFFVFVFKSGIFGGHTEIGFFFVLFFINFSLNLKRCSLLLLFLFLLLNIITQSDQNFIISTPYCSIF